VVRAARVAAALALLALLSPARAAAQPCCAGGAAITPARLAQREDALVGLQLKGAYGLGSFDGARRFLGAPAGTVELDLEQDLVAAVRVLGRGQLSLVLPLVETYRRVPGLAEAGGDLGDAQLGARWDFTRAGDSRVVPGIALGAGLTAPTGRAPEAARYPLATDATGTGAAQLSLALSLEQTSGAWLALVSGSLAWRSARTVGALREQQGLAFVASAGVGYLFDSELTLALSATYSAELAPRLGGVPVPDAGRAATRLAAAAGYPLTPRWRLQASLFTDLPLRFLGWGQPVSAGATFLLLRSF
jgi:hypothetical protein